MKKTVVLFLAILMAVSFCACRSSNSGNSSINSGMNSGVESTVSGMDSSLAESSGSLGSDIASGVDDVVSGVENVVSDVVSGAEDVVDTVFGLNDLRGAYENAGFTVTEGTYGEGRKSFIVKNGKYNDEVNYQVVTYDTAEEAQKECDKINSEGKKTAYTRGNALLIGEKDYEHHDEYSKPFQEYKK